MKPEDADNDLMGKITELAPLVRHKLQPWMVDGRRLTRPQALMALEHLRRSPVKPGARPGGKLILGDDDGADPSADMGVHGRRPPEYPQAGKTLGEMTPRERDSAVSRAAGAFQRELDVTAPLIGAVLDAEDGPADRRNPRPMGFFTMIPDGWYATASRTGTNDLDFWHVKTKSKQSAHAGRRFVDRIIGGHDDVPLGNVQGRLAMEAILAAGPEESGRLFGQEIGQCRFCKASLTRRVPRYNGQGNDCAANRGLTQVIPPEEWCPEIQD